MYDVAKLYCDEVEPIFEDVLYAIQLWPTMTKQAQPKRDDVVIVNRTFYQPNQQKKKITSLVASHIVVYFVT